MIASPAPPRVNDLLQACRHISGQKAAKRQFATLIRRQLFVASGELEAATSAIVCGPTGAGKSLTARAMCKASGLPFAEVNATQYTEKGYVGPDLSQAFVHLLQSAAEMIDEEREEHAAGGMEAEEKDLFQRPDLDEVIERAQCGILLLDEFDKWMLQAADASGRDKGRALQAELLKIVEGSREWVTDSEEELGRIFDSTRVMVLCCGAFVGLTRIVARRLENNIAGGTEAYWEMVEPRDFQSFGLLPELAGRLAIHIRLTPLRSTDYIAILTAEGGLLDEYRKRFAMEECELQIEDGALQRLADIAIHRGTGARGLRNVMEHTFHSALFEASAHEGPSLLRVSASEVDPPTLHLEAA